MAIQLPDLPFAYDALEPHFDAKTLEIHHTKHHKAYVDGFNEVEAKLKLAREQGDKAAMPALEAKLAFHLGGHVNHTLFFGNLAAAGTTGGGVARGALADAIDREFGGFDKFKAQFTATAAGVEGNGWAWLVYQPMLGQLQITGIMNHENQLVLGSVPILGLDVWEHAYYLKFQNRRPEFIEAFWKVANFIEAGRRYDLALGIHAVAPLAAGMPGRPAKSVQS